MSVVCGHNKTFDNLCHLGCGDAKSESERAREQESKRARKRASERARAKERGRERESPWVLGREPIVSLLLAREKERERERTHRRRLWTREKVCVCECVCEREKQKGREREVSCMQNNQYSDCTLSAFRIARPWIENYTLCLPACAELQTVLAPLPVFSLARFDSFHLCCLGCEDKKSENERARE